MTARRRNLGFDQVIARLRSGAALNLQYVRSKPAWTVNGVDVAPEIVSSLIDCGRIEPTGDASLGDGFSQTWRTTQPFDDSS